MQSTPQSSELDDEAKLMLMRMAGYDVFEEGLTCWLRFPAGQMIGLGTKKISVAINEAFQIYIDDKTP